VIYPSIDKLLSKVGSKYLLVNIVNKRVKQMEKNEHYQLKEEQYRSKKNVGRALEEIEKDLVHINV
jgi:DNA-directed RNA polymerase subunit omega